MSYFQPFHRLAPRVLNSHMRQQVFAFVGAAPKMVAYPPMVVKKLLTQFIRKNISALEPDRWLKPGEGQHAKDLSLLIGDTILDIKNYYEPESINGWLDCSTTYLTLQENGVLSFPISGDDAFYNVTTDPRAQPVSETFRTHVLGQKIARIYYYYNEEGEADDGHLSFIELENGYVITESTGKANPVGPANLFLYTHDEFMDIVKNSPFDVLPWMAPTA